jgi:predicted Zn-dependent protease
MSEALQACREAHEWMQRGNWRRAESAVQRGLQLEPESVELLYARSRLAFLRDEFEAREHVLELLRLQPEHAGARLLLARIEADKGRAAEAERLLLALLRESPQDSELLCHYALLLLRAGQPGKARQLAVEAVRHEPEDLFVLSTLALLDLAEGRPSTDCAALEKMLDLYPESESSLRMLAFSLVEKHQLAAAKQAVEILVRRSPHDASVIRLAAMIAYLSHWSLLPMYPMLRWGWAGSFILYGGFMLLAFVLKPHLDPGLHLSLSLLWLSYAIYSWVYPPLLRKAKFPELNQ